jgi:hypothetical protein
LLALTILIVPTASAAFLREDFESFTTIGVMPQLKPTQPWYLYSEGDNIGNVTNVAPIPFGSQAFRVAHNASVTGDVSAENSQFDLTQPVQITQTNFTVRGTTLSENGKGSTASVFLESSAPRRELAQFYVFCIDTVHPAGCELRVRWQNIDSTGQVLINTTLNQKQFNITVAPTWTKSNFILTVNGVNDGTFPFMELPNDFQRISFHQYRGDIPMKLTFDRWDCLGCVNANTTVISGDAVTGLQGFAYDMHFRTGGSLFIFGLILFFILMASVLVPSQSLGKTNAIFNALSFYGFLVVLWLITIEFWPTWMGITLIIICSALIGLVLRRFILGIQNAGAGAGLIVGCLGYFIIASTFLGFSGYASQTIDVPSGQVEGDGTTSQSFVGAVAECIVTGGAFTFGLIGDCNQNTVSKTWKAITDIFSWIRTAINFLFQLLTFRLPIPVIFNMMIVLPPAAALATFAFQLIRGQATA